MTLLERQLIWHLLWGRLRWLPVQNLAVRYWLWRVGAKRAIERALAEYREG